MHTEPVDQVDQVDQMGAPTRTPRRQQKRRAPEPGTRRLSQAPSADELARIAQDLEGRPAQDILAWALEAYHSRITLACSFGGPTGMVLLDMVMRLDPAVPVFYLDTGLLFPETYALVEEAATRYGIAPLAVHPSLSVKRQAEEYGEALWARDPDRCCELRKVLPQREALSGYDAWITGLRRDQASTRGATPIISWDEKFGLVKVCPLATWTERDVWQYIAANNVPRNKLHEHGYPSLGCTYCTRPIGPGEDLRAGRWSGFDKTECGLHTSA